MSSRSLVVSPFNPCSTITVVIAARTVWPNNNNNNNEFHREGILNYYASTMFFGDLSGTKKLVFL